MMPFDLCPLCGGELAQRDVEKLLRGRGQTAVLRVQTEVCRRCGERLYAREDVSRFQQMRATLRAITGSP
jgi:YgiT-type zinc finger domain-containing protein